MGKNKKGPKANVFKVAGAKSLKKSKAKAVNLGLKNIKQTVSKMDKEFLEITKNPTPPAPKAAAESPKPKIPKKKPPPTSKEEVINTAEQVMKMDL